MELTITDIHPFATHFIKGTFNGVEGTLVKIDYVNRIVYSDSGLNCYVKHFKPYLHSMVNLSEKSITKICNASTINRVWLRKRSNAESIMKGLDYEEMEAVLELEFNLFDIDKSLFIEKAPL